MKDYVSEANQKKMLLEVNHKTIVSSIILTKLLEHLQLTTSIEGMPEEWTYEDLSKCLKVVKKDESTTNKTESSPD